MPNSHGHPQRHKLHSSNQQGRGSEGFLLIYYTTKNLSPKCYNLKIITLIYDVRTIGRIKNYFLSKSMQKKKKKLIMGHDRASAVPTGLLGHGNGLAVTQQMNFFFFVKSLVATGAMPRPGWFVGSRHWPCRDPTKHFFFWLKCKI